uniref:Calcyclin-binding protein n=1 Tax=Daphnia magna TaxID=35525 RepID=A0A0P5A3G8_9CRUS
MPRTIDELRADVDELKKLTDLATRQSVKDVLGLETRRLETEISLQLKDNMFNLETKPVAQAASAVRCYEVKLTNYAWDQSDKFFKLFVTLPDVQTLPAENVACTFGNRSLDLLVKELNGKNYSLVIKNLAEVIDASKSHWKVKSDSVVVFLAKLNPITWQAVTMEEKKIKESKAPKFDASSADDPQASMMNMMKQLYQEGDDDMKRQIAKSFAEGRGGKTPDLGL